MVKMKNRGVRGFTLIELMIVVVVIGVLVAFAYPSYIESVRKGKRAQARTALLELMQQQERYMTQRNTYLDFTTSTTGTLSAATVALPTIFPFKNYSGDNPTTPPYWLSAAKCTGTPAPSLQECVSLTAAPTFDDPAAGTLSLMSTGAKSCTGFANSSSSKVCWP